METCKCLQQKELLSELKLIVSKKPNRTFEESDLRLKVTQKNINSQKTDCRTSQQLNPTQGYQIKL